MGHFMLVQTNKINLRNIIYLKRGIMASCKYLESFKEKEAPEMAHQRSDLRAEKRKMQINNNSGKVCSWNMMKAFLRRAIWEPRENI